MPTHFQYGQATNPFFVRAAGLTTATGAVCQHGQPAVALALFGRPRASAAGGPDERLDVVIPRCTAADFIGTLMATVRFHEGDAAAQALADDITASTEKATAMLQDLNDQRRDCCEAGFRTLGREHTCTPTEADRG